MRIPDIRHTVGETPEEKPNHIVFQKRKYASKILHLRKINEEFYFSMRCKTYNKTYILYTNMSCGGGGGGV